MTPSVPVGELRALGDRALLIGVADATAGRALASTLAGAFDGAADVVCGTATVMVHATDPDAELRPLWGIAAGMVAGMAEEVVESRPQGHAAGDALEAARLVTVPCRFDGPDLAEVAALGRCAPDDVVALLTAHPLTVAVVGFSPGFAYLGGLPAQFGARAAARPPAPGGPRRVGGDRQRARRRLPHGVAGWMESGRPDRLPPLLPGAPALRRAGPRRPGPLHRCRGGRAGRATAGDCATVVGAARGAARVRGRGPGAAGGHTGRWPARRRPGRGPGRRSGRSGVVRAGQSARRQLARRRHARAHGGWDPASLPRSVPCRRRGRRTGCPRGRDPGAARPAAAAGRRSGARGRPPARRLPYLPLGGGRLPRAGVVREQRQRRVDGARRRPARPGGAAARRPLGAPAGGPRQGRLRHRPRA